MYFGDDDNTYDMRLFAEFNVFMEHHDANVGVLPVGLAGGLLVERPMVDLRTGE